MKLGDLVANEYTSDSNPYHVLLYIRRSGKYHECLSRNGEGMQFYARSNNLTVVGRMDFSVWDTTLEAPKAESPKPAEDTQELALAYRLIRAIDSHPATKPTSERIMEVKTELAIYRARLLDEAEERLIKEAWARGFEGDGEWMRVAVRGKGE